MILYQHVAALPLAAAICYTGSNTNGAFLALRGMKDEDNIGGVLCFVDFIAECALWLWRSDFQGGLRDDERVFADDGALHHCAGGAAACLWPTHCARRACGAGAALAGAVLVHRWRLCAQ